MYDATPALARQILSYFSNSPQPEQLARALTMGFDAGLARPEQIAILCLARIDAEVDEAALDGEVVAHLVDAAWRHVQRLHEQPSLNEQKEVATGAAEIVVEVCQWQVRHGEVEMINDALVRLVEALPEFTSFEEEGLLQ